MEERVCKQCGGLFRADGEELVCPCCLGKLHGGRFGYRRMESGPFQGKWPVFDHQRGTVLYYGKDEDMAMGSVLILNALESLGLIDADL